MADEVPKFVDEDFSVDPMVAINQVASGQVQSQLPVQDSSKPDVPTGVNLGNLPPLGDMSSIGGVKPDGNASKVVAPAVNVSGEDTAFLCEAAFDLIPRFIWKELPKRTPEQLGSFNTALVRYCNKKGIDPNDYLFDELGIVIAGAIIVGGIKTDLDEIKAKKGIGTETKSEKHDNIDFNHAKELTVIKDTVKKEA